MIFSGQQDITWTFCAFIKLINLAKEARRGNRSNLHAPKSGCKGNKNNLFPPGLRAERIRTTLVPHHQTKPSQYLRGTRLCCACGLCTTTPSQTFSCGLAAVTNAGTDCLTSLWVVKDKLDELWPTTLILACPRVDESGFCWACPGSMGFA